MIDAAATLAAYATAACGAARVEVHAAAVAPAAVADADQLRWSGDPCGPAPVLRLEVLLDGQIAARYTVRPSLTVHVEAWVADRPIPRGELVAARRGLVPLDRSSAARVSGPGPWRARSDLDEGQPLTDATVTPLPDAPGGASVDVVVIRGPVRLVAPGRLLADGWIGEPVRVHNEATHTAVRGVLIDEQTVEIQ
ncbi:MAG TPA: hypothetical protein ENK18_13335 [Deltaproteobacteria bacterium]|nr:hypothetical protein [Deltaproteobacteria bacterium]